MKSVKGVSNVRLGYTAGMFNANSKVLVLGGEGFVGSHIVDQIPCAVPLDNRGMPKHRFENTIVKDIRDNLDDEIGAADVVIHAACRDIRTSMREPMADAETNILGTLNVLMTCRRLNTPLLYVSSVSVHSEVNHYAVSKSAGERYTLMYRQWVPTAVVRLSNVFGPRDTESVVARWLREPAITVISAEATRDFTYVEDSVRGILTVLEKWPNEVYNIGTGVETSLAELARWLAKKTGKTVTTAPVREIDNVIKRVVEESHARKGIGFSAKWKIYEALETMIPGGSSPL